MEKQNITLSDKEKRIIMSMHHDGRITFVDDMEFLEISQKELLIILEHLIEIDFVYGVTAPGNTELVAFSITCVANKYILNHPELTQIISN